MIPGKFELCREYPDYYKALSLRLYTLLDCATEASTELRDMTVMISTTEEIRNSFTLSFPDGDGDGTENDPKLSTYICGSRFEGTSLADMRSDIDRIVVLEDLPVVTDISDAQQYNTCLLMVQNTDTPAGYVKLQLIINGNPQYMYTSGIVNCHLPSEYQNDNRNRIIYTLSHEELLSGTVVHGPARTEDETNIQVAMDHVFALRCQKWPACAAEWLTRRRPYNWPSRELIDRFKTQGCFFVCVGHPLSDESDKQWRMSFSLQERYLVSHFNSVQLKCYVLLKIIKKEIIFKAVGEKSLTSYHCKTCMLYMIEHTTSEFWSTENFLICVCECLKEILEYVETGYCPNYFIPNENMFEGRITGMNRIKLCDVLRWLLASDLKYLVNLKTGDLGEKFREAIFSGVERSKYSILFTFHHNIITYDCARSMLTFRNSFSTYLVIRYPKRCLKQLHHLKSLLKTTNRVTEHTQKRTRKALGVVPPHVEIYFQSVLAVLARRLQKSNDFMLEILTSHRWHQLSLKSDSFSSKLKQASLLYATGHCGLSLASITILEQILRQHMSICPCQRIYNPVVDINLVRFYRELSAFESCSEKEFLHKNLIPCVLYLPAERDLTPPPLCFEKLTLDGGKTWHDGAAVDGKILLYYLLYLNHQHFGMEANCDADVANIKWLIETDFCLGHKETDLNILGWIYESKGHVTQAVSCYQESLAVRPHSNPALIHMHNIARTCAPCAQ